MRIFKVSFFMVLFACSVCQREDSLELVHVLFRHGARTPELKDTFPNDPYKEKDFEPMGWGQLTNLGKQMAFTLGQVLRQRYNRFLGEIYKREMVRVQSTDVERTKASAQLVLAGLFPPRKCQVWNEHLLWLPIPVSYVKQAKDYVFERPIKYCPVYIKELNKVLNSEEVLAELATKRKIFDYLTNHTGRKISTFGGGMALYQTLTAELYLNLTLPEWTKSVYPEVITELAIRQSKLETSTPTLRKLFGGRILQRIIKDMLSKIKGDTPGRKIYLYSGHEHTTFSSLATLGLYGHYFPEYSAATIFELHRGSNGGFFVRILYQRKVGKEPEVKQIRGCDIFCPLEKFLNLTESLIPKNYTMECESKFSLD